MQEADVAKRYAEAIYKVSKEKNQVSEVYEALNLVMELYENNPDFKNFMLHPLIEKKEKKDFINKILSGLEEQALEITDYLIDKQRMELIRSIVSEYLKIYYFENNEIEVKGIFSKALSDTQYSLIKEKLEKKVGKKVDLKITVDENIIGGGIIKIEDEIIDGSIKRQIENIKNNF